MALPLRTHQCQAIGESANDESHTENDFQVQCIGYIKYNIDRIPLYPITSDPTKQQKLVYPCIPWLPIQLSNRSWYTWIYVVLWKHMSEDVDMHDTSSTTHEAHGFVYSGE